MANLNGTCGLITGVANKRSIAWAIARAMARDGARLALTYQGERLLLRPDRCRYVRCLDIDRTLLHAAALG